MNLFYLVGFNIHKAGGKSRATRQKIKVLSSLKPPIDFRAFFPLKNIPIALSLIFLEFYVSVQIFIKRPSALLSRGGIGFLPLLACKICGILYVREVHADIKEEVSLLRKNLIVFFMYKLIANFTHFLDLRADSIIFNHPILREKYCQKYRYTKKAFYSYNGFDCDFDKIDDALQVLEKYDIPSDKVILSFTGSVSEWHGIDYIYEIAKVFLNKAPDILIVVAGGRLKEELELPNILNISPLDSSGCDEIIQVSHACLLPVKANRLSPGSPLKLYDYIKYNAFVFAQENTPGYSDEVTLYGNGVVLDFSDAETASEVIVSQCKLGFHSKNLNVDTFSWYTRMLMWISFIEQSNER